MQYLGNIPDLCEMLQFPQFVSAPLDKFTLHDSTMLSVVPTSEFIKEMEVLFVGINNALKFVSTSLAMSVVCHVCYVLGYCQWVEQKSYFCGEVARCLQYFKLFQMKETIYTLSIIKDDFGMFYFLSLAA